jgi:hypothetical protein
MAGHPFANCNNLQTPVKEEEEILSIKFKERFLLLLTIRKRSAEGKPGGVQKIAKPDSSAPSPAPLWAWERAG